jgi:gliding motility-associated-like protein
MKNIQLKIFVSIFFIAISLHNLSAQDTIAFQGAEPGDNWPFTVSGASAIATGESLLFPNYTSGNRSIVAGGLSGGGSCFSGGSGNGASTQNVIVFENIDISTSSLFERQLTFNYGNRLPSCNGTGYDSGENLSFIAVIDGVAQAPVVIFTGGNNAVADINQNFFTFSIPTCVTSFGFRLQVNLNRNDELLFVDDVTLTSPQLNAPISAIDSILGQQQICFGSSETIYNVAQVSGLSYSWFGIPASASFTSINNSEAADSISINWGETPIGNYSISLLTSNACGLTSEDTLLLPINIIEGSTPINIIGQDSICQGSTAVWSSNIEFGNLWSTTDTTQTIIIDSAGTYTLTVQDECGVSEVSKTLVVTPLPVASISVNGSLAICPGQTVILSSLSAENNLWTGQISDQELTVSEAGEYILTVSNVCGISTDSIEVVALPQIIIPSIDASNLVLCAGASLLLSSDQESGNTWSTGSNSDTLTISNAGTYILSNTNGCDVGADTIEIFASSFVVDILATPETGNAPLEVDFSLNSSNEISSYNWNIANLEESFAAEPGFTFNNQGDYIIYVDVIDTNGCLASDSIVISVLPVLNSELVVPNCFTPNGDGFNDSFKIKNVNISDFEIQIFNRWGGLVFTSNEIEPGWNGISNNNIASPEGTYFYILLATGTDGEKYEKVGSVSLLR